MLFRSEEIERHFPSIVKRCAEEGYDVFNECIPVVPAQHYFMGGVRSGLDGKTTMPRLYAVGETCCNGVHGANRLASNSLLESLLFAERAASDIGGNFKPLCGLPRGYGGDNGFLQRYADREKLFKSYKEILIEAIKEKKQ